MLHIFLTKQSIFLYGIIGQIAFIVLIVVTLLFFLLLVKTIRNRLKQLEKENKKIKTIIDGTKRLFSLVSIVDLENDTYEFLENDTYSLQNVPAFGCYHSSIEKAEHLYLNGNSHKKLNSYLTKEYITEHLTPHTDRISLEFTQEKEEKHWGVIHIICLKRKNGIAKKVLISTVDITNSKRNQLIQKRIPELIFETTFTFVGLIDIPNKQLTIQQCTKEAKKILSKNKVPFNKIGLQNVYFTLSLEDAKLFARLSNLDYIQRELTENGKFDFILHHRKKDGSIGVFQYYLRYFDSKCQTILCAVTDITEESHLDPLTQELNLDGFIQAIEKTLRTHEAPIDFAILHFDIKDFKAINSLIGFDYGDEILKNIASSLKQSKLEPIAVCRSMADHFYCFILQKNLFYDEITKLCHMPIEYNGKSTLIQLQCGIYCHKEEKLTIWEMCDRARLALQLVKNEYAMPYGLYKSGMDNQYLENTKILAQVEAALKNCEFQAFYQPIFDAKTHNLVSAEALIRWIHPEKGLIPPNIFIPILEKKGFISNVDLFIYHAVQTFLENRKQSGKNMVPISVNLSRMDFFHEEMLHTLVSSVEHMKISRKYLRFEITESAYIDIANANMYVIDKLHSLGCNILVDDFGTGYSSLGNLSNQTFDIIKLDMSFVKNIGNNKKAEAIIKHSISMCHEMGAEVIAEGVETLAQLDFLSQNHCDYIQGYYFSKPLPQYEFEKLLG